MPHINFNQLTANAAISTLGGVKGLSVLVVGCNRGEDCERFIDAGATNVVGLDVMDEIGDNYQHPNVVYLRASAEEIPLEDNSFDLVYCFATMEHIPRVEMAFTEMARVTKIGGCLYSVAAPLWNSSQGHHMPDFPEHPWIHLRKSRTQLVDFCLNARIPNANSQDTQKYIDYMLSDQNFNMLPAIAYLNASRRLSKMAAIKNGLRLDNASLLTEEIFQELRMKGFDRLDLLARTHWYVGIKTSGDFIADSTRYLVFLYRYLSSTIKRVGIQYFLSRVRE